MANTYAKPPAIIAISVLFPILGVIAVLLRIRTRIRTKFGLGMDDWLAIVALGAEFGLAGLMIWGAATRSLGDVLPPPSSPDPNAYLFSTSDQQIRLQQIQYYFDFIGAFALGFLKLSILLFYRRLFCVDLIGRSIFSIFTNVMIWVIVAWTLTFGIGGICLCGTTPSNAWAPVAVVAQKCSAQLEFLEAYAITDFITDVVIWTMPIPKIWKMHLPTRRKLAVIGVFLVGILTISASAARMAIYIRYIVNAFEQSDGETLITFLLFWTMIECGLSVIVVCLPTLRPLVREMQFGSVFDSIRSHFSLRSLLQSRSTGRDQASMSDRSTKSSSYSDFSGVKEGTTQTTIVGASYDLERQDYSASPGIIVRNEVQQQVR